MPSLASSVSAIHYQPRCSPNVHIWFWASGSTYDNPYPEMSCACGLLKWKEIEREDKQWLEVQQLT